MVRFLTAGESHGPALTVIVDDIPAGVSVSSSEMNQELARRQVGYGRGGRMKIETDTVEILSGVRFGQTTGAPISLLIQNKDYKNWESVMAAEGTSLEAAEAKKFVRPRPGHADLAGFYKYGHTDLRDVLERASARETAARVAAGAVAKCLLKALGIEIFSHVTHLGGITVNPDELPEGYPTIQTRAESNDLRCAGREETLQAIRARIDEALQAGTTLGGEVEIVALGLPPGLGSYVQWDRKLDGLLAQALMSVHAVKSVTIGLGEQGGILPGRDFHDEIVYAQPESATGVTRPTNRAGGLEAGVTNGMPLLAKATMKPIATMRTALQSINLETGEAEAAHFERSDVTAVPACGVVCEAMMALVLAKALLDKFGHDTLGDIQKAYQAYQDRLSPKVVY